MATTDVPNLNPLEIATTQRRMLTCFAIAIFIPIVLLAISLAIGGDASNLDMEIPSVILKYFWITALVQVVATIAYMVTGFQLIRRIGWSPLNQIIFAVICLVSMGCGLLLFVALLLINTEANRILRSFDVKVGLLGASKGEIERLRAIGDE